ncbi:MAG: MlaD family protein [Myxococcota bacterium]
MQGTRRRLALLPLLLAAACTPPAFELTVTFPGPVDIEAGAEVRYQGVPVGTVAEVSLTQPDPEEPARVELHVVIHDDTITLRRDDVFEIDSDGLMEDEHLSISAAPEPSTPLANGAVVAGRPDLAARMAESAEQAFEKLGALAREQAEILADTIAQQIDPSSMRPDEPAPDGAPAPGSDPDADPDAAPATP